jgi:glycosyltransferase involved in cell wall biosynthesis
MRITVITPTFNQATFLPATAESILSQAGDFDLEWLVIDGGSMDDTLDYLNSITDPRLRWISEKDRGQGDAINKGLALASGEVVAWLNSDDLYAPASLSRVAGAFRANPQKQWLFGRCDIVDESGREIRHRVTAYKDWFLRRYSYRRLLRENFISQPAVFWRRSAASSIDESLHYTMDYDLWLRLGKLSEPIFVDEALAHFRFHPTSKSGAVSREQFDEQYRVAARYFGRDWRSSAVHRFNVEKIVWAYRLMRAVGR